MIKPLDFVSPKSDLSRVGLITEISSYQGHTKEVFQASVSWIGGEKGLYTAWWREDQLEVIDNLPILLANRMAHPFGSGKDYVKRLL